MLNSTLLYGYATFSSTTDGYLGLCPVFFTMNNVAVNGYNPLVDVCFHFSWDKFLEVEVPDHTEITKLFSKVDVSVTADF